MYNTGEFEHFVPALLQPANPQLDYVGIAGVAIQMALLLGGIAYILYRSLKGDRA